MTMSTRFVRYGKRAGVAIGLIAAALPASAADLATQFPDLKMPAVMLAASEAVDPPADAEEDLGVEGELMTVRRPGFDLADRLTVANLPAHRDFVAVVEEAKREAMGYKALGTKSVASSLPSATPASGRTVASFASASRFPTNSGCGARPASFGAVLAVPTA